MKKLISIFVTIVLLIGCVSTKDKSFGSHSETFNKDSVVSMITDSIRKVYEEKYKELGFYVDFYNDNIGARDSAITEMQNALWDSSVATDSLRNMIRNYKCPESTVKFNTDGSVELKGKIKSLNGKIIEMNRSLDSARKSTEKKADVKIEYKDKIITVTKYKKNIPLWWTYIIPFIIGYVLRAKLSPADVKSKIKKYLPWV